MGEEKKRMKASEVVSHFAVYENNPLVEKEKLAWTHVFEQFFEGFKFTADMPLSARPR